MVKRLPTRVWTVVIAFLVAPLTLQVGARQALVETVEGRSFSGEATLTNNTVVVDGTNVAALANLQRLSFEVLPATNGLSRGKGNGLLGYYFGRTNFQGSVVVRLDERVDFNWSVGEAGVPRDGFSVIWSGDVEAPVDGEYEFSVLADDVAEVTIASNVVVRAMGRPGQGTTGAPMPLQAGVRYPLELRYHDFGGNAAVKLYWKGPGFERMIVPTDRLYAKSRLPNHSSELLPDEGLLATYFRNADFTGETFTRVDPKIDFNWMDRDPAAGFSRSQYAVRWQAQLRADFSEVYTFHVVGDEPLRIWLEGRPLIMSGGQFYMTEVRESLPLVAGERYDLRVEAQSTSGNATMKLLWSSPSTPKSVIPSSHLSPVSPVVNAGSTNPSRAGRFPRGVVLASGSFVGLTVERASESVLRTGQWLRNNPISTVNAARIYCQPISRAMIERIPPGRRGLLLAKGDFVDGDFKSMENGQVKIGSVLLGLKTYDANRDVLAIVLRDVRPAASEFEARLMDQSTLLLDAPGFNATSLSFRDPALGQCRIDWGEVRELARRPAGGKRPAGTIQ